MSIMPLNSAAELASSEVEDDVESVEVGNIVCPNEEDSISKNFALLWKSLLTLPPPTRRRADQMTFLCIALLKTPLPLIGFVKKIVSSENI